MSFDRKNKDANSNMRSGKTPLSAPCDASPFPFLQPSAIFTIATLPRCDSREESLCLARNIKVYALTLYLYSPLSSLNQYLSSLLLPLPRFVIIYLTPPSFPTPFPFFFSPSIPFQVNPPPPPPAQTHQRHVCLPLAVKQSFTQAGFHAKARYPQGRIRSSMENMLHLISHSERGKSKGPHKELCHTWWNVRTKVG